MFMRWGEMERTFTWLDEVRRKFDETLINTMVGPYTTGAMPESLHRAGTWPRTNLYDTGQELLIRAELPGVGDANVEVEISEELVTLGGGRPPETTEGYVVQRQERPCVAFRRAYRLPCKVDVEKSMATFKNGILTIRMAKVPEAQTKRILVRGGE